MYDDTVPEILQHLQFLWFSLIFTQNPSVYARREQRGGVSLNTGKKGPRDHNTGKTKVETFYLFYFVLPELSDTFKDHGKNHGYNQCREEPGDREHLRFLKFESDCLRNQE